MKLSAFVICGLVTIFVSTSALADTFFQSDFIKADHAEKKWGIKAIDTALLRTGDLGKRGSMAVDIIKRNHYVGKSRLTVRKELGNPDSYFFSDTIYAYKIMPYPGENKENWHLVFVPDANLDKVKEVKIHKKCCYKLPF